MKQTTLYSAFIALGILLITACNKPEAVIFEDKSTAARADKSAWTATADSETPDGWENTGKASAVIDGKLATYWHTDYSVVVPYPHWVLIDMKKELNLVTVDITNRQASTPNKSGMKTFRMEASKDGSSFTKLGEFAFAITNDVQSYPVSSATGWRYLKITALEPQVAGTNHTFLAEVDVYTTK